MRSANRRQIDSENAPQATAAVYQRGIIHFGWQILQGGQDNQETKSGHGRESNENQRWQGGIGTPQPGKRSSHGANAHQEFIQQALTTGIDLLLDQQSDRDRNHHRYCEDHTPKTAGAVAGQIVNQLGADKGHDQREQGPPHHATQNIGYRRQEDLIVQQRAVVLQSNPFAGLRNIPDREGMENRR